MLLFNIPPSSTGRQSPTFHTISSPFSHLLLIPVWVLAALPLLIFLLLKHSSYLQHILLHILNVWANANPVCRMCLLFWRDSICFVLHLLKAFLTSFFLACCCGSSVLPAALLKLFISQQHAQPIYPRWVQQHDSLAALRPQGLMQANIFGNPSERNTTGSYDWSKLPLWKAALATSHHRRESLRNEERRRRQRPVCL